jgi:hypothetical protein
VLSTVNMLTLRWWPSLLLPAVGMYVGGVHMPAMGKVGPAIESATAAVQLFHTVLGVNTALYRCHHGATMLLLQNMGECDCVSRLLGLNEAHSSCRDAYSAVISQSMCCCLSVHSRRTVQDRTYRSPAGPQHSPRVPHMTNSTGDRDVYCY